MIRVTDERIFFFAVAVGAVIYVLAWWPELVV